MFPSMDEEQIGDMLAQLPPIVYGHGVPVDTDVSRWMTLYPAYVDSTKSRPQGRRVGREDAVADPTSQEVAEALEELGAPHVWENKHYSRDFLQEGRCRVDVTRMALNVTGNKKRALLREIGQKILVLRAVREAEAAEAAKRKPAPKSKLKKKRRD
ncbi:MAG: hypothetical protein KVP17_000094 [Porospora cf. gigantea B]|uniref:uncharacterized protein n=2 Tax=Porospora cf. gigantea B TaxID=2853592 RepID=UPI003571F407|nr:MAG: hypothetical protein KVP17_000094 [Porospora cf. gigantea B]